MLQHSKVGSFLFPSQLPQIIIVPGILSLVQYSRVSKTWLNRTLQFSTDFPIHFRIFIIFFFFYEHTKQKLQSNLSNLNICDIIIL